MSNILAIIPARMGSSRFPGKPMATINGEPMIGHVYRRVSQAPQLSMTVVATCDKEIYDYITSIGGTAVMTSDKHERASDRCAEALNALERQHATKFDIVVMVQGDEPMTHPAMISEAIQPVLDDPDVVVTNLLGVITSAEEFQDRNCIKVVCDRGGNALYFSREPIPTASKVREIPMHKQVCVIAFTRDFLLEYIELEPTPLEVAESIDMMRVLEHGRNVRMVPTSYSTRSVDTIEDLRAVEQLLGAATSIPN